MYFSSHLTFWIVAVVFLQFIKPGFPPCRYGATTEDEKAARIKAAFDEAESQFYQI